MLLAVTVLFSFDCFLLFSVASDINARVYQEISPYPYDSRPLLHRASLLLHQTSSARVRHRSARASS